MTAQGLTSRFDMSELSLMGLAEILPKYRALKRRIAQTAKAVLAMRPEVLVTIDSPDFCLRVARMVRAANPAIRIVHYVAPSVWAWRPGRARRMAGLVDQVLALLPFEPPYLHALASPAISSAIRWWQSQWPRPTRSRPSARLTGWGRRCSACCPDRGKARCGGWRPYSARCCAALPRPVPGLQVLVPAAPGMEGPLARLTSAWPVRPVIVASDAGYSKSAMFQAGHVALAASGTVSLELAAAGTPMVIAYDMNWLSRLIIARMLLVDTVTLVNLVSETRAVPEFIGRTCRPEPIADGLARLWDNPQEQAAAMALTMERLGQGGEAPGLRAARAILDRL